MEPDYSAPLRHLRSRSVDVLTYISLFCATLLQVVRYGQMRCTTEQTLCAALHHFQRWHIGSKVRNLVRFGACLVSFVWICLHLYLAVALKHYTNW